MKHRGARRRKGTYFGPFASAGAVGPHHQRAAEGVPAPHLLGRCLREPHAALPALPDQALLGPLHGRRSRIDDYAKLVDEAKAFLSGSSQAVQSDLATGHGSRLRRRSISSAPRSTATASSALSHVQAHQGINPHGVEEADVFAVHQDGGADLRPGLLLPHRPELGQPRLFPARRQEPRRRPTVLQAFLAQFYDDKPVPRLDPRSPPSSRSASCSTRRSRERAGHRVEVTVPQRGEKRELVDHALTNAREALGRKLAETSQPGARCSPASPSASASPSRRGGSRSTTTATSWAPTPSAP